MAKQRGTDGSLLASLPWTLAALAVSLLPHLLFLPWWISGAFILCAVWRYGIELRRGTLPRTWLRAILALGCFFGVLFMYETISGVGPGSALLAIMAAIKLLEARHRRDQYVLLFVSIFLVMSSLLREQYLWSLPYLLVAVFLIMTAWLRLSAGSRETARQSFAIGGRLVMYAIPLTLAMWVFFPRIATPFWSVPIDTGSGTSGLSSSMSPGDISDLSLSNDIAFGVYFEDRIPEPRDRYWRGLILYRFDGRAWEGGDSLIGTNALERIEVFGGRIDYRIMLEPNGRPWVFALDIPYRWTLANTRMGSQQQLTRVRPIDQRVSYEASSFTQYRVDLNLSAFSRGRYTELPPASRNPRTAALAQEMRAEAGTDQEFIDRVLSKFNSEDYYYTLQPPPLGSNPVDRFLFETRRGFCEHYASAFAVMMRAAGIPARVVLGYQGGEPNPMLDNYLTVRQSDAHAWTEVWLEGEGWRRVDPTAAVAPERVESGIAGAMFSDVGAAWGLSAPSALIHQLTLAWDALNVHWNDWILGYGPDKQHSFMEWLGMEHPSWRKMVLTMIGTVLGLIALIALLLIARHRPPPIDRARILYQRFVRKTGMTPVEGETPVAFASRVIQAAPGRSDAVRSITDVYLDARYGPPDLVSLQRLKAEVSAFRR